MCNLLSYCGGENLKCLKGIIIKLTYWLFRKTPINKKKVLLFSYYGEQYSGSPKYIGKYLSEHTNMKVIWAFVQPEKHQNVLGK